MGDLLGIPGVVAFCFFFPFLLPNKDDRWKKAWHYLFCRQIFGYLSRSFFRNVTFEMYYWCPSLGII